MNAHDLTTLVHLAGFATGVVLYAMLAVMTRRRLAHVVSADDRSSADRLPLVAAILGIVWNVGAMMVFATRDFGVLYPVPWVAALAYTALGFLPAVVVQSTLRRSRHGNYQWLVAFAYFGSAVAAVFHGVEAVVGEPPSSIGLLLLTITYAVIRVTTIRDVRACARARHFERTVWIAGRDRPDPPLLPVSR